MLLSGHLANPPLPQLSTWFMDDPYLQWGLLGLIATQEFRFRSLTLLFPYLPSTLLFVSSFQLALDQLQIEVMRDSGFISECVPLHSYHFPFFVWTMFFLKANLFK